MLGAIDPVSELKITVAELWTYLGEKLMLVQPFKRW
jgi:hypothetical protein